jgi:hypothetical protein
LEKIKREQDLIASSLGAGIAAITSRFATAPGEYLAWYLWNKPILFWGWDVQVGQGDIYVYPTVNSPFETVALWRAIRSLCYALNRWILLAAILGIIVLFRRGSHLKWVGRDSFTPQIVAFMIVYATTVYDIFQAEPRYSIPFRPFEFAAGVTAIYCLSEWVRNRQRRSVGTSPKADIGRSTN